jgi:hypothetical protein
MGSSSCPILRSARPFLAVLLVLALRTAAWSQQAPEGLPAASGPIPEADIKVILPPKPATIPAPPKKTTNKQPEDLAVQFWSNVPPPRILPRAGYFLIGPTVPGYYSLLDVLLDEPRPGPPKLPYPPTSSDPYPFFDADFRFLENPAFGQVDLFYPLKRIHPSDDWLLSLGGEERIRYMDENGGYERFTGQVNTYELNRARMYADVWYLDLFRFYVETQDSRIANNTLPPLPTDVDHEDFLNLFTEARLFSVDQQPAYVRLGRQELVLGSQRLVSQSDFPNVLRTFQGVRGFWLGKNWNVDAFWVQPVLARPTSPDPPDHNQNFSGLWLTARPHKGQTANLYYMNLDNRNPGVATGAGGAQGGFNISTIGGRYAGDYRHLLWDFETMYQFGTWSNQRDSAGAATAGLGYDFAALPWNPQFWMYNEWASGNQNPGTGSVHGTFNQLFPWGHNYFGYLDLVGRQNIDDVSAQLAFYPVKWITCVVQNHVFHLDSARDALYNASGAIIRSDPTGQAGTYAGDEIDFTTNFHLTPHQDFFVGYSTLFAGSFIQHSAGPHVSPALLYTQYSIKW